MKIEFRYYNQSRYEGPVGTTFSSQMSVQLMSTSTENPVQPVTTAEEWSA